MTKPTPEQIEAEVGEPTTLDKWRHDLNVINHTIERCAQVAFDAIEDEELAFAVVAAIRALKDK